MQPKKYQRTIPSALVLGLTLVLGVQAKAQVQRYNATAENGYGIVYNLPKTEYEVTVTIQKKKFTPGELAPWAAKYLSKTVGTKEESTAEITKVEIEAIGVPDASKQYLITFDKHITAPFVSLAPGNLLYSINGDEVPVEDAPRSLSKLINPDRQMPALPREYSLALTDYKRAEIAATYLYEIREKAMNIVSGEVEEMPKDGESMRLILGKLQQEEQRALRLFEGDTLTTVEQRTWRIEPGADDRTTPLFRFSNSWGIVSDSDATGVPASLQVKVLERAPELEPKELERREKAGGIIYNLPGMAEVSLVVGPYQYGRVRLPLTQAGTIQSLAKKVINLKESETTAVYFDLRSGALERITNE